MTDERWRAEVEGSPIPVLVDFWADWCAPCKLVAPVLEALARDREGSVRVVKLDVEQNPRTAERFQIRSLPTLMIVDGGLVRAQRAGALGRPALDARLESTLPRQSG
jgi:thioredoxin